MASRQEKWLGQALNPNPRAVPASTGKWKSLPDCRPGAPAGFRSTRVSRSAGSSAGKGGAGPQWWGCHPISANPTGITQKKWGKLANANGMGMRGLPGLVLQKSGSLAERLSSEETGKGFN